MSWNPMMGGPLGVALAPQSPDLASLAQAFAQQQPMGGGLPQNTLGASGVTLGNPQAQDQYAEMAQALAQHNRAQQQQDMAAAMMQPKYAENSGGLGSLAMIVQAYAGKKMGKRATADEASARERYYKGQSAVEEAKAAREAQQEQAKIAQRMEQAQKAGLQGQDAAEFAYTGKWPEAVRMNTVQGEDGYLYNVDPYNSTGQRVQVGGGQQQLPPNVHIDPNLPPLERAAALADIQAGMPEGDAEYRIQQPQFLRGKQPQGDQESYGQPQPVTGPDGAVRMVQFGNRGGQREVPGYGPPPTARDAKPPTEGERNAAGYFSRMDAAGRELDALTRSGYDPGNMRDHYTAGQGPLLNWVASEEGQRYRQQQEDWVRAKLRKESGAVIGDDEMEREIRTYFPQPGDKPEVLKAKAGSRSIAEAAMRKAGGRAIDPVPQAGNDDDLVNKYLRP